MNIKKTDDSVTKSDYEVSSSLDENKTIYQEKLDRENQKIFNPKLAFFLSGLLLLFLIIVFFILPSTVTQYREESNDSSVQKDFTTVKNNESSELAQKPIAQALLSELLARLEDLKVNGVLFWGGEDWSNALIYQTEGDSAYTFRQFNAAVLKYRESMQILIDLELSIPQRLSLALKEAGDALMQGNQELAIEQYEIALAIDGINQEAKTGYERALKVDRVIESMVEADIFSNSGEWEKAIMSYENALIIDPEWINAIKGLEISKQRLNEELFQNSLSRGYQLLSEEKFEESKIEFDQAFKINPNSRDALQAIEELELGVRMLKIESIQFEALIAEVNEQWVLAKKHYEAILKIDANIKDASESLNTVNKRISLAADLILYTANTENLSDDDRLRKAKETLNEANAIKKKGPVLVKQIENLANIISIASVPINILILSDEMTNITLYKVGQLGVFRDKEMTLRPGIYKAVGTRNGFRDVSLRFKVLPDQNDQSFRIECKERV
jgi:eukaryotic-like serine/threonine-protein kinase